MKRPLVSFPRWRAWRARRRWYAERVKLVRMAADGGWSSRTLSAELRKAHHRYEQEKG